MKAAGANANGAVNGFMGLGMMGAVGGNQATAAGINAAQQAPVQQGGFFGGAAQAPAQQAAPVAAGWTCSCGQAGNTGKFCSNCGQPQPAPAAAGWTCSCGQTGNTGKFCGNCGKPQPAAAPAACPKCGFKPADGNMPKFCPECGTKIG